METFPFSIFAKGSANLGFHNYLCNLCGKIFKKLLKMSLLAVGTVAFDAIETPLDKIDKVVGGSATYICLTASHFINQLQLVSVVGDDFPESMINEFKNRDIDTEGLEVIEGEKSFFWSGRYHDDMNGRDTLVTDLNVLAGFDPKVPQAYRNADYLMLGNIDPTLQMKVIEQMDKRPKLIMLDTMNFWMDLTWDALTDVLKHIDILTINDEEAKQLSGEHSLKKAAKKILAEMGPKHLIIKKGEHGALLFHNDGMFFCPAMPLEVVFDPTGAGDSFAGGFLGWLAKTNDLSFDNMKRAVVYGSAMASFCVEAFGPNRLLEINQQNIDNRIQQFIKMMDISM